MHSNNIIWAQKLKNSAEQTTGFASKWAVCLALTLASTLVAGNQTDDSVVDARRSMVLEEVLVTARRRVETLQEVPVSVTSLSGNELEALSAISLYDVQYAVPGLRMRYGSGDQSTLIVSLRGPTHNRQDVTVDPAVGIYVDDVPYAHPVGTNTDLLDIESIQVLQGPQGTLFGRNTVGGALLIQTKNPDTSAAYTELKGGAGNYGSYQASGVFNIPVNDAFAIRVAAQSVGNDGLESFLNTGNRLLETDTYSGRIKMLYTPTDDLSFVAGYEYLEIDAVGPALAINQITRENSIFAREIQNQSGGMDVLENFVDPGANTTYGAELPGFTTSARTAFLKGDWQQNWGQAELILSRRGIEHDRLLDADGTPYTLFHGFYHHDLEQSTAEFRISGEAADQRLQWQTGLFYFEEDGDDDTTFVQWPSINGPRTPQNNRALIDTKNAAVYGQATWDATDRFSITGGLRFSSDDKKLTARNFLGPSDMSGPIICNIPAEARPASGDCLGVLDYDEENTDYLISVDYKITSSAMVYLKHATGYRAGGLNQRVTNTGSLESFKSENISDYEAGLKADWLGGQIRTNASVYYSEYDDLLLAVQDFIRGAFVTNAGDVEQKGAQLTIDALVGENLRLGASFSYTDVNYIRLSPTAGSVAQDKLPGVPDMTAAFSVEHTSELSLGMLALRADYSWTDEINYIGVASQFEQGWSSDDVGLLNVRASLRLRNQPIELALWGRNVTDEEYLSYGLDFSSIGVTVNQWGLPAQWGVEFKYFYGK